ncbi:hypothetical protein PR048_016797 [Dryococelus australis]|uniref:Uncharacterized protein n=1 Tax=Dryococelus australis TaxID=614101 RepID=A0ABQ9H7Y6_9NEOP|nr:hypothetical protein PR048_016797 [Dryococelus australis]
MRVIEVNMEQRQHEGAGETGDPRGNPPTNGIVRDNRPGTVAPCRFVIEVYSGTAQLTTYYQNAVIGVFAARRTLYNAVGHKGWAKLPRYSQDEPDAGIINASSRTAVSAGNQPTSLTGCRTLRGGQLSLLTGQVRLVWRDLPVALFRGKLTLCVLTRPFRHSALHPLSSAIIDCSENIGTQSREHTADFLQKPPTNGIIRHDSHVRTSGVTRPGIEPGSPWWEASRLTTQPPVPLRGLIVQ